jgi:hypothetical protein
MVWNTRLTCWPESSSQNDPYGYMGLRPLCVRASLLPLPRGPAQYIESSLGDLIATLGEKVFGRLWGQAEPCPLSKQWNTRLNKALIQKQTRNSR